jgi:hypothetical protein
MKARRLIEGASFDPPTLEVIGQAFEQAWSDIAGHFDGDERQVARAPTQLAHAVLIVADEESRDVQRLKRDALEVLAFRIKARRRQPKKRSGRFSDQGPTG